MVTREWDGVVGEVGSFDNLPTRIILWLLITTKKSRKSAFHCAVYTRCYFKDFGKNFFDTVSTVRTRTV